MSDNTSRAGYGQAEVLRRLEEGTPPGQAVSAQVFLADTVSADELPDVVRQIVDSAASSAGESTQQAEIGKIHRRAKSFSVKASPSVIRRMSTFGQVKTVLPSELEEGMLIRPVKKTPVP